MPCNDLREFLSFLADKGKLKRISKPISPKLEMTEISDRVLQQKGPALLFENPSGFEMPVLTNLFGTTERVAMAFGGKSPQDLRAIGKLLSSLKEPQVPDGFKDVVAKLPVFKHALYLSPKIVKNPVCHQNITKQIDLSALPIQTCWPQDVAPLITWGLTITKGPHKKRLNLGIYRMQLIAKNKLIMRWLPHRGGALDFAEWKIKKPGEKFAVSVALGADPITTLAAVTPIPDAFSEYGFAGILRGAKTEICQCLSNDLLIPARAEISLEGYIDPKEQADEGPFGDHTGYYNEVEKFPVFTVTHITHRNAPIYHSTYTGRPPDEPSVLGEALNEVFVPILQKQFPEIADFYLPPAACSYRMGVIAIRKQYPGHAKRVIFGLWSFLRQFMYTKFVVVVDDDINIRNMDDVIWAISTRSDPARDTVIIENTPIDYLDFASPVSGLGSKMGIDATNKLPGETRREWGRPIDRDKKTVEKIDRLWNELGL